VGIARCADPHKQIPPVSPMGWAISLFLLAVALGPPRPVEGTARADEVSLAASLEAIEEVLLGPDEALRAELVVDASYKAIRDRGVERFRLQLVSELAKASGVSEERVQILGVRAPYADVAEASLLVLRARSGAGGQTASGSRLVADAGAGIKVDFVILPAEGATERQAKDAMKSIRLQLADANSSLHAGPLGWLLANARLVCCNVAPSEVPSEIRPEGRGLHHTVHRRQGDDYLDSTVHGALRNMPGLLVVEEYLGFPLMVALFIAWPVVLVLAGLIWFHCSKGRHAQMMPYPQYGKHLTHFNSGLLTCQKDPKVCACAIFCPHIRWATTVSQRRLIHFSLALCVFVLLGWLTSVMFLPVVLLAAVGTFYRRRLREQDGIPQEDIYIDVLVWLCCPCCAIAQEARHVEAAGAVVGPPRSHPQVTL